MFFVTIFNAGSRNIWTCKYKSIKCVADTYVTKKLSGYKRWGDIICIKKNVSTLGDYKYRDRRDKPRSITSGLIKTPHCHYCPGGAD